MIMGMTERRTRARTPHRGAAPYGTPLPQSGVVHPLSVAGVFAVYTPAGPSTRVDYCEPATGRCSCGDPSGSCPHIKAATSLAAWPRHQRRSE